MTHTNSRRRLRIFAGFTAVVLATIAMPMPMPAADAQVSTVSVCGARVVTRDSQVKLVRDLVCRGLAFLIEAANVRIDLNGHTVTNLELCQLQQADESCGIFFGLGSERSQMFNGKLQDIDVGAAQPDVSLSRLNLTNARVALRGERDQLLDSVLADSRVFLAHDGVAVRRNWIVRGNALELFNLDRAVRGFQVTNNVVIGSNTDGLHLSTYFFFPNDVQGEIANNVFLANTGDGLHFDNQLQDLGKIDIHNNTFLANGGDGIDISAVKFPPLDITGGPVTLADNNAFGNGGHGITATWVPGIPTGIVDGGGNRATGNALDPQCIGIAC